MEPLTFSFRYDRAFVREGFRPDHRWRCLYAALYVGALGLLGAFLFEPWSAAWRDPTFLSTLVLALVALEGLCAVRLRRSVTRTLALWQHEAPDGVLSFTLEPDALTVSTQNSRARHPWQELRRVWRYETVWLLEILRQHSVFFPAAAAPEEARRYLLERCREAGVRV